MRRIECKCPGKTKQGEEIFTFLLSTDDGIRAEVLNIGASLLRYELPDSRGEKKNIVLRYEDIPEYEDNDVYIGTTVGRNANRIAKGHFLLEGREVQLPVNDSGHSLHSCPDGWNRRVWRVHTEEKEGESTVRFFLTSPDGDQGFPGNAEAEAAYTLKEDGSLVLHYRVSSDKDTIVNMTNHSYYNPAGSDAGSLEGILLRIDADTYTEADAESIPTGRLLPVEGTAMDFRTEKPVLRDIEAKEEALILGNGYDHNYCLNGEAGCLRTVAALRDEQSGRGFLLQTTLPGVQLYTANFLDGTKKSKDGGFLTRRSALCLETQMYPDAPNHEGFPSTVLKAGEIWDECTALIPIRSSHA